MHTKTCTKKEEEVADAAVDDMDAMDDAADGSGRLEL